MHSQMLHGWRRCVPAQESVPSDEASGVFKEESCATYTSAGSKASAKNAAQSANWSAGKAAAAAQQAQWSVGPEPSAALPASAQGDAGLADTQGSVVELKPDDIQKVSSCVGGQYTLSVKDRCFDSKSMRVKSMHYATCCCTCRTVMLSCNCFACRGICAC